MTLAKRVVPLSGRPDQSQKWPICGINGPTFSSVHYPGQTNSAGQASQSGSKAPGTTPKMLLPTCKQTGTPKLVHTIPTQVHIKVPFKNKVQKLKLFSGGAALAASFIAREEGGRRCETCQCRKRFSLAQRLNLEPTDSSGRMFSCRRFDSPQTGDTYTIDTM